MAKAQCSTAGNFFLRLGGGVETSRFMFQASVIVRKVSQ